MTVRLRFRHEGRDSTVDLVAPETTVGRDPGNAIAFPAVGSLSRRHAALGAGAGGLVIEDLGSRHGVHVNGVRVRSAQLRQGDVVRLGDLHMVVEDLGTAEDEASVPSRTGEAPERGGRRERARLLHRDAIADYRLLREIGSGGMGVVFEAVHGPTGRRMAVKVLRPHLAADPVYLLRFFEEVRLLTLLRHPRIVEVFARGRAEGLPFIVMELVEGPSVRQEIRAAGRLPEAAALRRIWDVARALDFAARHGVVHGDLKPGNFLMAADGARLCDFGLARAVIRSEATDGGARGERAERLGTAAYAAPECFTPDARLTLASDMYALGVSLYQMLSGRLPFPYHAIPALRRAHGSEAPPPLAALVPGIRPATTMLVSRLLAKEPARRPRSYDALLSDLALLL